MDKYEFNVRVDQIKKRIDENDYKSAMKIADTIDWRRVRNANLLSMIASVYEKNNEFQEAKEILLIAFERAPIGKRLLYKLAKLALKEGNVDEAEAYYKEFCDLAADDPRQYILRYLILQAKGASVDQLIRALEQYTNTELDERWMYELAELYGQAGLENKCIEICDKIMLMFGLGQYVDKAMNLKLKYAPLTTYQRDLAENKDKYEARLRAVEEEYGQRRPVTSLEELRQKARQMEEEPVYGPRYEDDEPYGGSRRETAAYGEEDQPPTYVPASPEGQAYDTGYGRTQKQEYQPEYVQSQQQYYQPEYAQPQQQNYQPEYVQPQEQSYQSEYVQPQEQSYQSEYAQPQQSYDPEYAQPQEQPVMYGGYHDDADDMVQVAPIAESEEELAAKMKEAEEQERLAREMSKLSAEEYSPEDEITSQQTRVLENIRSIKNAEHVSEETRVLTEIRDIQSRSSRRSNEVVYEEDIPEPEVKNHLMIEARSPELGLEMAVDALKKIHQETGIKNQAVKITGSRLSQKGIFASAEKLAGKDLIIEEAGDLTDEALSELERLMERDETGMIVVLIDNPRQLETLHRQIPSLASKFECIGSREEAPVKQAAPALTASAVQTAPAPTVQASSVPAAPAAQAVKTAPATQTVPEVRNQAVQQPRQAAPAPANRPAETDNRPVRMVNPRENEPKETIRTMPKTQANPQMEPQKEDDEIMGIDEFAQYACQFASEIDCSITGKSMLALYERIEIMEEDGILLTKENAEKLIEEAADNAEKRTIGKLIKGVFSSRYDKDGLLILKEEHFLN